MGDTSAAIQSVFRKQERQRCLIIADDLTGGADAGAQFAKRGRKTLLISFERGGSAPFAVPPAQEVLVINTHSRGQSPEQAAETISALLKSFAPGDFPILFKKIDSTLRGNIGAEIDAILGEMNLPLCFLTPSYPEQNRFLKAGMMMVGEKPVALTEAATDAASPVHESDVASLLARQTSLPTGRIDLADVSSGTESLRRAVARRRKAGSRIIAFDAVSRQDLAAIAEAAFAMETMPLLAGSAGLAGEVARILAPVQSQAEPKRQRTFRHLMIIGGSASALAHAQLQRLQDGGLPAFELPRNLISGNSGTETEGRRKLARWMGRTLAGGSVIFRTFTERWTGNGDGGISIPQRIADVMADAALETLREARVDAGGLALILTGGDTAQGVLKLLNHRGIELEGEPLEGVAQGNLCGGPWDGLTVVTKAGAFGNGETLKRIVERLTQVSVEPPLRQGTKP